MLKLDQADPLSTEIALDALLDQHILTKPVLCSCKHNWQGLLVRQYIHTEPSERITFPSIEADLILVHLGNATPVDYSLGTSGQPLQQGYAVTGSMTLLPRGTESTWRWERATDILHIYILPHLINQISAELVDLNRQYPPLLKRILIHDLFIHQVGSQLQKALSSIGLATSLYVNSLIQSLGIYLIRNHSTLCPEENSLNAPLPDYRIKKALDYIHTSLEQDIRLSDMEKLVGISQYHFIRLFKAAVGVPPYQYILQQRVEKAKRLLLEQKDISITEVAIRSGFPTPSQLNRSFQKLVGTTPKVYRNL